jgi:site-specific DNA recombinase
MTPTYSVKGGVRYRYYVSWNSGKRGAAEADAIVRVPAAEVERAINDALQGLRPAMPESGRGKEKGRDVKRDHDKHDAQMIQRLIERATITSSGIEITLGAEGIAQAGAADIRVPWTKPPTRVEREVLVPAEGEWSDPRVMSWDTRSRLLSSIARARRWLDELISGRVSDLDALAAREIRNARSLARLLSLAFVAPDFVKAVAQNRLPRGIGLSVVSDLPSEWSAQWRVLGISTHDTKLSVGPCGATEARSFEVLC